ncbi:MAG: TIGR00366 family protein, partial [Rhodothermales bacterium]|nr:TIGR00366 family protein [Rhodothermales bacterium]
MKLTRFKAPDTTLIIFTIIVLAAVLTWFIPPGAFDKVEIQVEGVGTREVVVPGSFEPIEREGVGVLERLLGTVSAVLTAPIEGFVSAAEIIAFVLLIGGAFGVLQQTGAIDAGLRRLVGVARESKAVEYLLIPLFMLLFALGGATFGMSEETVPFILIFVPLALSLGYDSITGVAIPFVGAGAGFAGAFLNPFTIGIAQGIAEVPVFSGKGLRFILFVIITAVAVAYVMWHAHRVKANPQLSPVYELDRAKRREGVLTPEDGEDGGMTSRHAGVLLVFFLGIALLVFGVTQYGWYIVEIAALFVGLGIVIGAVGGLAPSDISRGFMAGARDLLETAVIIGLARGILVVMEEAQIIDPILNALAGAVGSFGPVVAAQTMFLVQTAINFFVPSGSGQAALTMPVMAPLADLLGVSRQTAVLAYQMGDGFTNLIIPTSAIL